MILLTSLFLSISAQGGDLVSWGRHDNYWAPPPGNNYLSVAIGPDHGVAIRADGSLASWGRDDYGQVSGTPTTGVFTTVSAGIGISIAIREDGSMVGWGRNDYGMASDLPTTGVFTQVAIGSKHVIALDSNGKMHAWGFPNDGLLRKTPTDSGHQQVFVSNLAAIAIRNDGSLVAWGDDLYGQISGVPPGSGFRWVNGSRFTDFFHAINSSGQIMSWGTSGYGQHGFQSTDTNWVSIEGGIRNSIALRNDGTFVVIGDDSYGQVSNAPSGNGHSEGHVGEVRVLVIHSDDFDLDLLLDSLEPQYGTSIFDQDSDDDGLSDGEEVYISRSDPLVVDSDGDGIQDGTEAGKSVGWPGIPGIGVAGTDSAVFVPDMDPATTTLPLDTDSDDDGLLDGLEDPNANGSADAFETDGSRLDSDADGIQDGTELALIVGTPDTDPGVFIPDIDPITMTDPLAADTDGGGLSDGAEDFNHDGGQQLGETSPNMASDDHFELTLTDLIPGQDSLLTVSQAKMGSIVTPAFSLTGPGPISTGRGFDLQLSLPITLLPSMFIPATGTASQGVAVPPNAPPGMTVYLQAIEILYSIAYRPSLQLITSVQ